MEDDVQIVRPKGILNVPQMEVKKTGWIQKAQQRNISKKGINQSTGNKLT